MQIPVMNGIYTDQNADFRTSYPLNLIPVPKENGISQGYLRPAEGIDHFADLPGIDRGGIEWNGICYR
ncbi:packaged DNA stabilization protein, partial [Acinetobacter baumannii]